MSMESESESQTRALNELSQKNVAYYQVMFNAFIETRNEIDKQMLTISVAALGFLLGLSEKLISGCFTRFLLATSSLVFLAAILWILNIFSLNARYIEKELRSEAESAADVAKTLEKRDQVAKCLFGFALILTVVLFFTNLLKEG